MNNEEKILELLQQQDSQISKMSTNISALTGDVSSLVLSQIQTIAEGVSAVNNQLIARSELDSIKEEMAKDIIRMHTNHLNNLKKAR